LIERIFPGALNNQDEDAFHWSRHRSDRRSAGRYLRFGHYRIAYWKPFSIHWPHFHRHRIHWRRIP
jgi:hypothetical protein